jgi:hypothetical protein
MTTSNSVAQIIAETAAELDDAFELPDRFRATSIACARASRPRHGRRRSPNAYR